MLCKFTARRPWGRAPSPPGPEGQRILLSLLRPHLQEPNSCPFWLVSSCPRTTCHSTSPTCLRATGMGSHSFNKQFSEHLLCVTPTPLLLLIVTAVESRGVLCVGKMPVSFPRAHVNSLSPHTLVTGRASCLAATQLGSREPGLNSGRFPSIQGPEFLLVGSQISACYRTLSLNL